MNDVRLNAEGSSPLTRGKLEVRGGCPSRCRLIPAHAGKTTTLPRTPAGLRAHPRSRGENLGGIGDETEVAGSSPLTRGKRVLACEGCVPERLIPAHAGKTQTAAAVRSTRRAHPRSRGEN